MSSSGLANTCDVGGLVDHAPLVQHDHPVRHLERRGGVLLHQEHADAVDIRRGPDHRQERPDDERGQAHAHLVDQQEAAAGR